MSGWIPTVGGSNLTDLSNVDTTGVQDEDVLMYDLSDTTWKAALPSIPLVSETGHILELEDGTTSMSEPTFRS